MRCVSFVPISSCFVLWLALTVLVPSAAAQRVANEDIFQNISVKEAIEKAREEYRVAVVFVYGEDCNSDRMFERTFTSPLVWAYVKWHCVAVKVRGPAVLPTDSPTGVTKTPTVVFIRKGREFLRLPDPQRVDRVPNFPALDKERFRYISSIHLVGRLNDKIELFKSTDSLWYAKHVRMNPMPKAPDRELIHLRAGDGVEALLEPPPGEDPLAALAEARRLVKDGNFPVASALYTWLWERGAEADTTFEPAQLSVLASDIAQLGERYPPALARFKEVLEEHTRRSAWFNFDRRLSWAVLAGSVGARDDVLDFIDGEIDDEEEAAVSPLASVGAFKQIGADFDRSDPNWLPAKPADWLGLRIRATRSVRPQGAEPKEWEELMQFRTRMLLREGCRLYVACLRAGRDEDAEKSAVTLLGALNTADARLGLVATAIAAQQVRPAQRAWLDQAGAAGADPATVARLRRHLEECIGTLPAPAPLSVTTAPLGAPTPTTTTTSPAVPTAPAAARR